MDIIHTDQKVKQIILEILNTHKEPIKPEMLYAQLANEEIREYQARRIVVELAVDHTIAITADRRIIKQT